MKRATSLLLSLFVCFSLSAQKRASNFSQVYLDSAVVRFNLLPDDVVDYSISDNYISSSSGIRHIYLQQEYRGVKIFNAIMGLHILEDSLIHATSSFIPRLSEKVKNTVSSISAQSALISASDHLNLKAPTNLKSMGDGLLSSAGVSEEDIPYSPIYQELPDGRLVLCWDLIIKDMESADWWDIRVDASTGEVVDKTNWTVYCNWGHDALESDPAEHVTRNHHIHIPSAEHGVSENFLTPNSYKVLPLGIESPNHGMREIVVNPADATASPYGWHDTNGVAGAEYTFTRGNNVHAYEDRDADNMPGFSPDGGASLEFDFSYDATMSPIVSESAVITNLFYWNNLMHDIFYQYGFDEGAGNFQENNYGNGGTGADYVNAEAQDGSGLNNANFSTPPDGTSGRMQMFLYQQSEPVEVTVNSPMNLTFIHPAVPARFGDRNYNLTGNLVLVDDGTNNTADACAGSLTNAAAIAGNIALIDAANCQYGFKALTAQQAGAVAVIIYHTSSPAINMFPGTSGSQVTIPTLMVSLADGQTLLNALQLGVNLTLRFEYTDFDSDMDNGIIAHEYGHGISNRLTGGPSTSSCLDNAEQMGEGWSDWFGLMVTMRNGDMSNTARGIGTYVRGEATNGNGIRPFPYTTDMGINPQTYDYIKTSSVPHGVGSVWCTMLWDLVWSLIDQYGLDQDLYSGTLGNNRAMNLIMEAMKLQPCSPGFIDGRDAILQADEMMYGGANKCLIWKVFARRGLGYSASQGSSSSVTDGIEAFDLPPSCFAASKSVNLTNANVGDTLMYTIVINTTTDLSNINVWDTLSPHITYIGGSANGNGQLLNGNMTFEINSLNAGEDSTLVFKAIVKPAVSIADLALYEDAETINFNWKSDALFPNLGKWSITNNSSHSGARSWFAVDMPNTNEQYFSTMLPIMPSTSSKLKFWHSYNTEVNWDGGLVEVSTDNGTTWQDLGPLFSTNGYNGMIDNNNNLPAFSGQSGGYIESIVDLASFADQLILVRFRMHTDQFVGGEGWYVDDITVTNLNLTIPNTVVASADQSSEIMATLNIPTLITRSICQDLLTLNIPLENIIKEYRSSTEIQTSASILGNSSIFLYAGNKLQFNPGFEIQSGSEIVVDIEGCDPPPPKNQSKSTGQALSQPENK